MEVKPMRTINPDHQQRIKDLVVLWQLLALAGISIVSILTIWHLKRRGMIVRNRIKPPLIRSGTEIRPDEEQPQSQT